MSSVDYYPKVSVIILTYNAKQLLGDILDMAISSALNQTYRNMEVLIVDNGSSDETANYIESRYQDKVKVVRFCKNYGYCLGNNLAARYVDEDSKYLLFMNSDVVLANDYVEKLVAIAEGDPRIAALQRVEMNPKYKNTVKLGGCLDRIGYFIELSASAKHVGKRLCLEVPFIFGAASLVRRYSFEKVGGFSNDFFMYYDEPDLAFRLRSMGYKVVSCFDTYYLHYVGHTVTKSRQLSLIPYYFSRRNRLRVIIRYYYGASLLYALLLNFAILIFQFLKKNNITQRISLNILLSIIRNLSKDLTVRRKYIANIKRKHLLEALLCSTLQLWKSMS